jgi:GNAT superfamily N-acetyltransferase
MKIVSFREFEEEYGITPILVFYEELAPERAAEEGKFDPRMRDGPVGFCAVENDKVVSFVGVLDLQTKTIDGDVVSVGGIYGVYTLPTHARRGIATKLMERAHQYFVDKGYMFSFLTTSRTIIAYNFYRKLGYKDAVEFPSAYKLVKKKGLKTSGAPEKYIDWGKIRKIYGEFSADKAGFVVRDERYFQWLEKPKSYREGLKPETLIVSEKGYVIFREEKESLCVDEFIAADDGEMRRLIQLLEGKGKNCIYDRIILNEKLLGIYQSSGYFIKPKSYGLLMAKRLTKTAFEQAYGKKFFMTNLDYF